MGHPVAQPVSLGKEDPKFEVSIDSVSDKKTQKNPA